MEISVGLTINPDDLYYVLERSVGQHEDIYEYYVEMIYTDYNNNVN